MLANYIKKLKTILNRAPKQTKSRENVSGDVLMSDNYRTHFVEGMRKIYELEPFIKLESSLVSEESKGLKIQKRAI